MNTAPALVIPFDIESAATLWMLGKSTRQIAQLLGVDESEVWNRLTAIKQCAREGR